MAKKQPEPHPEPPDPHLEPPILGVEEGEEIGDYDETMRYLARLDGQGLFEWLLRESMPDFDHVEWMDARLTTSPNLRFKRTGDLRARLRHRAGAARDCSMQLESQTRHEPGYAERLLEYQAIFYRQMVQERLGDQLAAFTIYLTGDGPETLDTGHEGMPFGIRMNSGSKALRNEDAGAILTEIQAGATARIISAFVPLMQGGVDPAIIEQCKAAMAEVPEAWRRADLAAVALSFAPLTGRKQSWQNHFKGWNMEQSEFLRSWMNRGVEQGIQIGIQRGRQQGLETGRQQGLETGRQQGVEQVVKREASDHQAMLERILKQRFSKHADDQVLARVASETNLDVLKMWTEQAAVAKSWKAFRDAAGWK